MSEECALYRHYGEDRELLYVGIAGSFLARTGQHIDKSPWADQIAMIKVERFDSRAEAREAEARAILEENPVHNRLRPRISGNLTSLPELDEICKLIWVSWLWTAHGKVSFINDLSGNDFTLEEISDVYGKPLSTGESKDA